MKSHCNQKVKLGSLAFIIVFALSACGSPTTTSTLSTENTISAGPIDGHWTINSGLPENPTNSLDITNKKGVLTIYSGMCIIALQYTLSYPANNQVSLQSEVSQAGDNPIGCAVAALNGSTALQFAQSWQSQ